MLALIGYFFLSVSQEPTVLRDIMIKRVDQVRFYSSIDDDSVGRLEQVLESEDIVDLSSPGGSATAMIDMADLIRERGARVKVSGECGSACSFVWITAKGRIVDGFDAVTFHGTPLTALALMRQHPGLATPQQQSSAERNVQAMERVLADAGVEPWLFHCAYRLMEHQWTPVTTPSAVAPFLRLEGGAYYSRVWFPREILEQAGVRHLEKFDAPTVEQKQRIEARNGPGSTPDRIFWAQPGDCDVERLAGGDV